MKKRLLSSNYYNKRMENGAEHIYVQSIPTLFKYQASTEYSLHNFEADEIWGTVPSSFNDPYDCAVCFTPSKLITSVMSHLTEQRLKNYAILLGKSSKKEIAKQMVQSIFENNTLKSNMLSLAFQFITTAKSCGVIMPIQQKGFVLHTTEKI